MKKTLLAALASAALLPLPAAGTAPPPDAPENIARGLMILHGGRMIFSPCRERSYVHVDDVSPNGEAASALRALGLTAERPLYAELFGTAEAGTLRMTGINFAHTDARCHAPRHTADTWHAMGGQPAWRLTATGDVLRVEREAQPDFRAPFEEQAAGPVTVRLHLAGGTNGHWTLRRGHCLDRENGLVSGWSVQGRLGGETLAGCAWKP
ncbi:hypothetical protein [Pseudothauera rhizosphaerae]|uniref:Lipoprotein n=1 Tax=Pseudothauera rhizosphaerae TaxID=2565932 RepID=A0A4S4AN12_9RHOO|nr:hypothetical protein [Pseudothauera rhizosphaerae]THF61000.1 hypothetical protein E6O51_12295 [Pseudothauera rhizosphaerae]